MELLTLTVYKSNVREVMAVLKYVAYAAAIRQHQDPNAPQPPHFTTQILNRSQLGPGVPLVEECLYYGVCAEEPDPLVQIGDRLLTVLIKPAHGNAFCLAAWQHPLFPLKSSEIHDLLVRYFGKRLLPPEAEWTIDCPPEFRDVWPDQALAARGEEADPDERNYGSPPKGSTLWLQHEIEARGGLTAATDDLYDNWLEIHEREVEYKLKDPRRSFERAVKTAMNRIRRKQSKSN